MWLLPPCTYLFIKCYNLQLIDIIIQNNCRPVDNFLFCAINTENDFRGEQNCVDIQVVRMN